MINKKIFFLIIILLITTFLFIGNNTASAASEKFSKVKNLQVEQLYKTGKVKVSWNKNKNADQYIIKLFIGSKLKKKIITEKKNKIFKSKLFKAEKKYKVKVKIKATDDTKSSLWRQKRLTYAGKPSFSEKTPTTELNGSQLWLFAVNDGEDQLALSQEINGEVKMARFDMASPDASPAWQTVLSTDDLDGASVADHWHIFAHGFHYIVASVDTADKSVLLKLDKDFNRVSLTTVTESEITNDMFMVESNKGVVVGHYLPGYGHKLFILDQDGNLLKTKNIGGGQYIHSNGASVIKTETGYSLFAGTTLDPNSSSFIKQIDFNSKWEAQKVTKLLKIDNRNINFATAAFLDGDYLMLSIRMIDVGDEDSGEIYRYIFYPNSKTVYSSKSVALGNRPHTTVSGNYLITSWDEVGAGTSIKIENISYK
ncbi:MAG: hypothetical protein ABIG60_05075 [Patescibacteria group bacterium]